MGPEEPREATTIAAGMSAGPKPPPPAGSIWERIERARQALEWNERKIGAEALGNPTHYTKIWAGGWGARTTTQDKLIERLVREGFSESWLRLGTLPERSDAQPIPEPPKISTQLRLLASRLGLHEEQLLALWADLEGPGPLDKLSDEARRAAFAAAYMEGRTLEDVKLAARQVMRNKPGLKGIDSWLHAIRVALEGIEPSSGKRPGLVLVPFPEKAK